MRRAANLRLKVRFYRGRSTVTQRCGYKSAEPLACFVQFIAHFSRALFSLILSHADLVCVCLCSSVCAFLCANLSGVFLRPLGFFPPFFLSYNIYRCLFKNEDKEIFEVEPKISSVLAAFHSTRGIYDLPPSFPSAKDFCWLKVMARAFGAFSFIACFAKFIAGIPRISG